MLTKYRYKQCIIILETKQKQEYFYSPADVTRVLMTTRGRRTPATSPAARWGWLRGRPGKRWQRYPIPEPHSDPSPYRPSVVSLPLGRTVLPSVRRREVLKPSEHSVRSFIRNQHSVESLKRRLLQVFRSFLAPD